MLEISPKRKIDISSIAKICLMLMCLMFKEKAYSSGVERTAHNG